MGITGVMDFSSYSFVQTFDCAVSVGAPSDRVGNAFSSLALTTNLGGEHLGMFIVLAFISCTSLFVYT